MDNNSLETHIKTVAQKVENAPIPQNLRERIIEELSSVRENLKLGGAFTGFENLANYINLVLSLPFNKETNDVLDLGIAKQVLDKNHYGLNLVKDRILEYISSLILNKKNAREEKIVSPILCLVGLVGTGKTTLAYSIAQALNKKFERIAFGGIGEAFVLKGQSRMLPDATAGLIIKSLINAQSKNPVLLLDEIDRVTQEGRADIMGVLVEILDSEQNKSFMDHYIDYPFDLSKVLFVATANNTSNISTAVLDRLEVIQMPSYTDEEKTIIAKNYLFPKIRKQTGLLETQINIEGAVWPVIIRPLGFDPGMRTLERSIEAICRKVARLVVEKKVQSVRVTNENIREFLQT